MKFTSKWIFVCLRTLTTVAGKTVLAMDDLNHILLYLEFRLSILLMDASMVGF